MWNTLYEKTKYQRKWINANNETKPLRIKHAIKMTIFK